MVEQRKRRQVIRTLDDGLVDKVGRGDTFRSLNLQNCVVGI